jgi:hypothetical protein
VPLGNRRKYVCTCMYVCICTAPRDIHRVPEISGPFRHGGESNDSSLNYVTRKQKWRPVVCPILRFLSTLPKHIWFDVLCT